MDPAISVDWNLVRQLHVGYEKGYFTLGFHDYSLVHEMVAFISLMGATSITETGTAQGMSTKFLAQVFPNLLVFTCDNKVTNPPIKAYQNIHFSKEDSKTFLQVLPAEKLGDRPFFFLDAHRRGQANPLLGELNCLTDRLQANNFTEIGIAIHDFCVPDKPYHWNNSGFDGTDMKWETISVVEPFIKGGWYPTGKYLSPHPIGRIYLFLSIAKPLPTNLEFLEKTGLLQRFL